MIWRLFMFKKLLPLLFLFAGFQANATLIDNGDYSTDTESGLDWLDWTLTVDKTQAEALTQFGGAGWRIATESEALGLMENFFDVDFGYSTYLHNSVVLDFSANRSQFVGLMGQTHGPISETYTYSLIEGVGKFGVDNFLFAGHGASWHGRVGFKYTDVGIALVKVAAVSEPAIIALFALGVVGIGFARRRQY
jgi:hypothetical protein